MSRASAIEHVQRLNMAIELLKKNSSRQALSLLCAQFHLSTRQAYRYLKEAESLAVPLPLPEAKAVFTVKLPESLITQVRRAAHTQGQSISDVVALALAASLRKQKPQSHG